MVQDYRGVVFSFQQKKTRRRRQRLKLALLALLLLAAFTGYRFLRVSAGVSKTQDLLLSGRIKEADKKITALSSSLFLRADIRELRALSDLFHDRLPLAQTQFDKLKADGAASDLRSGQFQKYFLDRGEYPKLKIYTAYRLARGGDEAIWFHALVQSAMLNGSEAEKAVARLSPDYRKKNAKALALLAKINADLRQGRCEYIFDKNGSALAAIDVRRRRTRSLLPGLDFSAFNRQIKNGLSFFRLTLDARMQNEIHRLFSGYHGTLLLLELPGNGILAAYSKPRPPDATNAVFFETYEPGSSVKIVTLLAYLRQEDRSVFPFNCPGQVTMGKRILYDGAAHKQVKDPAAALAVSCNISFAEMGRKTGLPRLAGMLELFRFNAQPFRDGFLEFPTGTFNKELNDDFRLANLVVGLNEITLTTVHGALLAAVFSQNGLLYLPYLIDDAKSILNLGYYGHKSQPLRLLNDDPNFRQVRKAIRQRLKSDGANGSLALEAELAVKTAIAGDAKQGLDAMAIGFFPFDKPRYAFAFRLEGAGKTELNEAGFLRGLIGLLQTK